MKIPQHFKIAIVLLAFTFSASSIIAQQTKTIAVSNFNEIAVSSDIDLYLTQGNSESIKIIAPKEHLSKVVVGKNGTRLNIRYATNNNMRRGSKDGDIKVYVTFKNLRALFASGDSDIKGQNTINVPRMTITASGGSDVDLHLITTTLDITSSGGSDIDLRGKATNMNVSSSGGSDVDAKDFIVENARVSSSGGSDVELHVTKALDVTASGGSEVTYKGDPAVSNHSSKSGSVSKIRF
ncbi:head GIN domain-containing protein [Pedobacter sp.]|uniref:head GIN domain-containing protein n=1 Tax=Pedobacter sp. TaxID=1411316 RepID=UPI003D7F647D